MKLTTFLKSRGFPDFEGNCENIPMQQRSLKTITRHTNIRNMLEIGFNAGHSAQIFLEANPYLHLTSYDIGEHDYVSAAKEYIDITFPGRHTLILGDSKVTVPQDKKRYDAFFIDGGHDYETALADMINCSKLANQNAIVMIDDIVLKNEWIASWTVGPTRAISECVANGLISELFISEYCPGRGMIAGFYNI